MGARSRWAFGLFLPVVGVAFLVVRAAWLAYVHTLSESELHQQVFEHSTLVAATLWSLIIGFSVGVAWWVAGRLAARGGADSGDQAV